MIRTVKKLLAVGISATMLFTMAPISADAAPKAKKLSLTKKSYTIEVGKSFTIKSKGKSEVKAKINPAKANKAIKVKTGKKDVLKAKKINKYAYRLTAVSKGKATVTVQSLSNKKLKQKMKVVVKEKKQEVVQESFKMTARQGSENKIEITFSTPVKAGIVMTNFKLRDKTGNSDVALSGITIKEDKKNIILNSLIALNAGSEYEVVFTNPDDGKVYTTSISSSKGDAASIKLVTKTVPINISKKIKFAVYDAKGVDITSTAAPFVALTADIPSGKGFFNPISNELKMYDSSATAKIKMVYTNGSKKVEAEDVISVTSQSTESVSLETWTITTSPAPIDWSKAVKTDSATLAIDNTVNSFYVKLKTSDGKEIKSDVDGNVMLSSTDKSVFDLVGNKIQPKGKGTATLIVDYIYEGKSHKFTPLSITIGDQAKPQVIIFSQNSSLVAKDGTDKTVKITAVKDQYGASMDLSSATWTFNYLGSLTPNPNISIEPGNVLKVEGNSAAPATYNFRVDCTIGGNTASMAFAVIVHP